MDKLRGSHSPASPPPPLRSPPPSFISFFPFSFYCLGNGAALELRRAPASNFKGEEASACKGGGTRRSPGSPLSAPWGSKPAAGPRFTAKATRSRVTAGPGGTGSTGEVVKTKKSRINEKKKINPPQFLLVSEQRCSHPTCVPEPRRFRCTARAAAMQGGNWRRATHFGEQNPVFTISASVRESPSCHVAATTLTKHAH